MAQTLHSAGTILKRSTNVVRYDCDERTPDIQFYSLQHHNDHLLSGPPFKAIVIHRESASWPATMDDDIPELVDLQAQSSVVDETPTMKKVPITIVTGTQSKAQALPDIQI